MSDKHIEDLYQHSRQEAPPVALDNLILAQAQNSCNPNKRRQTSKRNWIFSLSTAAVVALSFSIIFNLQYENEQMIAQPERLESHQPDLQQDKLNLEKPAGKRLRKLAKKYKDSTNFSELKSETSQSETLGAIVSEQEVDSDEHIQSKTDTLDENNAKHLVANDKPQAKTRVSNTNNKDAAVDLKKDIQELKKLIEKKQFNKAKLLLKQLQKKYPSHDFSVLEKLVD